MPRFVLLEHVGHPDDAGGRHFDLLLEDGPACRTWKLLDVPQLGSEAVAALELPRHRLEWLDTLEAEVSGNRGVARRLDAGTFEPAALDADSLAEAASLVLELSGARLTGRLRLEAVGDGWAVRLGADRPTDPVPGYDGSS
jgi:hypothetical protein